jgi:hypothetical protein
LEHLATLVSAPNAHINFVYTGAELGSVIAITDANHVVITTLLVEFSKMMLDRNVPVLARFHPAVGGGGGGGATTTRAAAITVKRLPAPPIPPPRPPPDTSAASALSPWEM